MEVIPLIVAIMFITIVFLALSYLKVSMYFLDFKLENHPALAKKIENVAYGICKQEGITVFDKTFEEININKTKEEDKAVGMYIYTTDGEYQKTLNRCLNEIEIMEKEYRLSYKEICKLVGHDTTCDKEDFILPKILIAKNLKNLGLTYYYCTFFHELGHHFAYKEMGVHTEADADRHAGILFRKYLPPYVLLIHSFSYSYARGEYKLNYKEKIIAFLKYLKEEKPWLQKNS
jgi:hypothetical protein